MTIVGKLIGFVVERRVAGASLEQIAGQLEASCDVISGRMTRAADTPANRAAGRHVIGMERWGAHRLSAGLEGPVMMDEYDAYCPPETLSMAGLVQEFLIARAATLALAGSIKEESRRKKVVHNDVGPMSVGAWLSYLNTHALMESRRIK